jgi:hypothetical protein
MPLAGAVEMIILVRQQLVARLMLAAKALHAQILQQLGR